MILIFNKNATGHFLIRICIVTDRLVMTKLSFHTYLFSNRSIFGDRDDKLLPK